MAGTRTEKEKRKVYSTLAPNVSKITEKTGNARKPKSNSQTKNLQGTPYIVKETTEQTT
jgi:hypothetical protein